MELATLKLMMGEQKKLVLKILEGTDELLEAAGIDWDKVRSRNGVLTRNRAIRVKLVEFLDQLDMQNGEISSLVAEITDYTKLRDHEISLRRKLLNVNNRYVEDKDVPDPDSITPKELP